MTKRPKNIMINFLFKKKKGPNLNVNLHLLFERVQIISLSFIIYNIPKLAMVEFKVQIKILRGLVQLLITYPNISSICLLVGVFWSSEFFAY